MVSETTWADTTVTDSSLMSAHTHLHTDNEVVCFNIHRSRRKEKYGERERSIKSFIPVVLRQRRMPAMDTIFCEVLNTGLCDETGKTGKTGKFANFLAIVLSATHRSGRLCSQKIQYI